jgi:hypothetical protein
VTGPAAPDELFQGWLDVLAERLPASRRTKAAIVAELDDGLRCALEVRLERGDPPLKAAQATVVEFGAPADVARAYARQLTGAAAHRTGRALVASGPVVGLVWAAWYGAGMSSWPDRVGAVLSAMPFLPVLLAVTIPAALLATAASGRWAARAAVVATGGCLVCDASLIAMVLPSVGAPALLLALAMALSALRLCLSGLAMRRVLRLRAAAS